MIIAALGISKTRLTRIGKKSCDKPWANGGIGVERMEKEVCRKTRR